MLAKSLARDPAAPSNASSSRPTCCPSDVTGQIYNQRSGEFEFRAGPIVAHVVLADEINRATPKTQSALLEAMEEQQVTVEGVTRPLPAPFIVLATQNPIEYEARFRCPRRSSTASCCAFTSAIRAVAGGGGAPERQMLRHPIEDLRAVTSATSCSRCSRRCAACTEPSIQRYIARRWPDPRPSRRLPRAPARAAAWPSCAPARRAMLQARDYVIPDDVKPSPPPPWPTA